ncbi:MAG TPA: hypothetical protein VNZ45_03715, partial [Bacteroidia bacterium]|nr:hypothetical protein [Bacteroidia bacterium]
RLAGTTGDTYYGSATFYITGSGTLRVAYAGTNSFYSNVTTSGSPTFGDNGGLVSFEGANQQILSGSTSFSIPKFRMNKLSINGVLTINNSVTVSSALTLNAGKIIMTGGSIFTINNSVTVSGGSSACYFDGAVTKVGNTAFTFPIGNGNSYMPLTITAPSITTDAFQAQAFAATPPNSTSFDATIKGLITGYWNLSRTNGTSSVQATLYWNPTTPRPIFQEYAHVAMYNSKWKDNGSNNLTFSYLQGSVTSNALTSYGKLTLGFTTTNPTTCATCDTTLNWATVRSFDEYGRVIDDKKIFADNLGRVKQSQQRNLVANKILAQAGVYDTYGRSGLST